MKLLVASDIFGETPDLKSIAKSICDDFLVVSPYSDARQQFISEEQAYASFLSCGGITSYAKKLAIQIETYQPNALVGFSVGATAGWLVLSCAVSQGIQLGILFYGSRMRDYMHLRPSCPVNLFFAEHEKSVDSKQLVEDFRASGIKAHICIGCRHGFMNQLSPGYDAHAKHIGVELAKSALIGICQISGQ